MLAPMKALPLCAILFGVMLPLVSAKDETEVPFEQCPAPVQAKIRENAQKVQGTVEKVEREKTKSSEFYDANIAGADGRHWSLKVTPDGKVMEWKEKNAKKDKKK
jgi:hypothetical protein